MQSAKTMTTPSTLNLPTGEYLLSIEERATRDKLRLPVVYRFFRWNDNISTPIRRIRLNRDMKLTAEYKVAFGATIKLWAKIIAIIFSFYTRS